LNSKPRKMRGREKGLSMAKTKLKESHFGATVRKIFIIAVILSGGYIFLFKTTRSILIIGCVF